jgi:hypothetical protein
MPTLGRLRRRLRLLARSERGMALPTALFATIASLGFATTAVVASVDTQRGTARDSDSKSAIAAADAGAGVAMMRLNRYSSQLSTSYSCLSVNGSGQLQVSGYEADGWCPEIRGTVGGSTYAYRVSPFVDGATMSVVATGSDGVVGRRIATTFRTTTVGSALGAEGLIGQDSITMSGNADIQVGVGTNGDLVTSGNAEICNHIRHGVGKGWINSGNATQCDGYSRTEGNVTLPPVSSFMPSDIATNNFNYRLAYCTRTDPPPGCQSDTLSGGNWSSNSPWDADTRTLSLSGNKDLTLGGGDYWMCRVSLSGNSTLYMAEDAHVRIFFDTPENCGTTNQISLSGNNTIEAAGYQPEIGQFDLPGFYLLGSPTLASSVNLSGNNSTNEFIVYGPNTTINISGNATYKGVIAGKAISISGNGHITQDDGFEPPQIGGATLYQRQSYVECTGASASPPNAGC